MVSECHRLRKIPLRDFTTENIRIMLSQNIGIKYLLPLALEKLEIDFLDVGDYFSGDLLSSVLRLPLNEFSEQQLIRCKNLISVMKTVPEEVSAVYANFLKLNAIPNASLNVLRPWFGLYSIVYKIYNSIAKFRFNSQKYKTTRIV